MSKLTVVFGNGAIGHLVTQALLARGDRVRIAQRNQPARLPMGAEYLACDILDAQAVREAVKGASQVLLAVGFLYDARFWRTAWPAAMANIVEVCGAVNARVVFIDNLYQLGPQTTPRTEDMPLTTVGEKPVILADITRIWMAARDRADAPVLFAALRCLDFYGPGVSNSYLGTTGFGALAKGKAAQMLAPDTPHDFAYAPDIARAVVTLLDAPDDAYGQVWNMPCAPTRTPRDILRLGADAIGVPLKVMAIPLWLLPLMGIFIRFMKEVVDVGFTWDRPYHVDASKFKRRFWSDVTPFEVGAAQTARSFLAVAEA
ncbi:MAG: NAD-dependent epimerase/dehydratase family protein [Rhodoferax sp.]|uniref:NAD-dependent epimerase/dehydratase family protein n=1 Tax=Rhodoferax sp. TaxID=50421 RepID=UPI003264333C